MSKLFEEAIADAKKLKEVAEENAKKAILESVTPQIREFIEEQLLAEKDDQDDVTEEAEEAEEVQKETLDEEVYLDEGALASLVELIGEENLDSLNESKSQEALFSAVKGAVSTMDDVQREKLLNLSHKLNESANHLSKTAKGEDMSKKYYEVDLRTLREALEEDYKMEEEEAVTDEAEEANELEELYR